MGQPRYTSGDDIENIHAGSPLKQSSKKDKKDD